jgi:hypothetical protein
VPTIASENLWQLALARWAQIGVNRPDLGPALALQQRLLRFILDAASQLDRGEHPGLRADAVLERWHRGVPALRNEILSIPQILKDLLPRLCDILAAGGAGDGAARLRSAIASGEIDAGSLLSVSLARNQKAIRTSALHMGFSPDLVWLVGELGSSPLAHQLQQQLFDRAGLKAGNTRSVDLQAGLQAWNRGYCPCCGSWPAFIELLDGSRALRCSFCARSWELSSHRCVYCDNAGEDFISAAPDIACTNRRVELCGRCGSYTKAIGVSSPTPFPLLAIEDLASMDLDLGAMNRQYRRPELCDLDSIEPLKSPGCA